MKTYSLILFDLDGTLTDPTSGLIASFSYALDRMHIDYGTRESLTRFIGPPLKEAWMSEFSLSAEEGARALSLFRSYFGEYGWSDNRLYDGVTQMLDRLRDGGCRIALATSKPQIFAERILTLFGIRDRFDFVGAATLDGSRERKNEIVEWVLAHFSDMPRSEAILVGDRRYDAEGAALCGIDSLGVLYGCGERAELLAAPFTAYAETVEAVAAMLLP